MRPWGKLLLIFMLVFSGVPLTAPAWAEAPVWAKVPAWAEAPVKIIVASDLHVYPASLHDDSETYARFEATGQGKMLSFSDHIVKAFVNDVLEQKPDAVILTGDLTLNGEKKGHEMLAAELARLKDAGIPVLVIPGNHDINNPSAREIRNDKFYRTDYVSPAQFEDIYAGLNTKLYRADGIADGSLSYIARIKGDLYALMLDTCVYAPNIARNGSIMGGTINQPTLAWMEESIKAIRKTNPKALFVTAMHHNLLQHHPGFDHNYVIQSQDTAVPLFEELGLTLTFSGHIHSGNVLKQSVTEITNGSLIIAPFEYNAVEFTEQGKYTHETRTVNMPRYAREQPLLSPDEFDFDALTNAVFERRISRRRGGAALSAADIETAQSTMANINAAFLNGRPVSNFKLNEGYKILQDIGMERGYLDYIFDEAEDFTR